MTVRTCAAVVHQRGGPFTFEDVELDNVRPDEAIVRMVACGVCHTDIVARDGLFASRFPAVFGHEGAGIVQRVGAEVSRARTGDRVVLSFNSCGRCSNCNAGHPAHCDSFDELNFGGSRPDGSPTIRDATRTPVGSCFFGQSSFAYHSLTRDRNMVPVGTATDEELALFASLGCGMQAGAGTVLNELRPRPGESLVVFGAGSVGLSALMAARIAGADPVVAVDIIPTRLELAKELGAAFVINSREESIGKRLKDLVAEVDHGVETTGISRVIDQAIRSLGPEGKLSLLGVPADEGNARVSPKSPGPGQRVFYSIAGDSDPQVFIPLLISYYREGRFPFDRLVREYPALKINQAVEDSINGVAIKPLLRY